MIKKALILGGTYDHIALIKNLKNRDYHTILLDYGENPVAKKFADTFIRESTLDKNKVLEIAEYYLVDLVIATCIDQALLTVAFVSEKLGLPSHLTYLQSKNLTNKVFMKKLFKENNIPSSDFIVMKDKVDTYVLDNLQDFPLVVKPADSNSSKGVKKVNNTDELYMAANEAFNFSTCKEIIIEGFVSGLELSVDVVVINSKANVLIITENIINSKNINNFTIIQSVFKNEYLNKYKKSIECIANKIALAFGIKNGPLLIQLLVNEENISLIEFSSRIGGGSKHSFIKSITEFDFLNYFIDIILDINNNSSFNLNFNYGTLIYLYCNNGIIDNFVGFKELKEENVLTDFYHYKTVGTSILNRISSSDRSSGFLVLGNTKDEINKRINLANFKLKILDVNSVDIMMHDLFKLID